MTALRGLFALACGLVAAWIVVRYPLGPLPLLVSGLLYVGCLWRWPRCWLVVLPPVLLCFDLAPWTGWLLVSEADLFVMLTLGVLTLREPPAARAWRLSGAGAVAVGLVLAATVIGCATGLASPAAIPDGSAMPYLLPENALRLAKGPAEALLLLPFLRSSVRSDPDGTELFAWGMVVSVTIVGVMSFVERGIFVGAWNFVDEYRVVGPFSSMHMGGGHIGACMALALPFLAVYAVRPGLLGLVALLVGGLFGAYALTVTFARAAYAAGLVGLVALALGWFLASFGARRGHLGARMLGPTALIAVAVGVVALAGGTEVMRARFATAAYDLGSREANWFAGMEMREEGIVATLFGMGLGTYPRMVATRGDGRPVGTNFGLLELGNDRALSVRSHSALYVGQKVDIDPGKTYRLSISFRSPERGTSFGVALCEKLLLYSVGCRGPRFTAETTWTSAETVIAAGDMGRRQWHGLLARPVELSLMPPRPGTSIQVRHLRLIDPDGNDVLSNGDFRDGMDRWYFTEDDHLVWRMKNQYLMTLFETGLLGLVGLLALLSAGWLAALRGMVRGDRMSAVLAAALLAFAASSVFDYLLEAPRIAALFYLICFLALTRGEVGQRQTVAPG